MAKGDYVYRLHPYDAIWPAKIQGDDNNIMVTLVKNDGTDRVDNCVIPKTELYTEFDNVKTYIPYFYNGFEGYRNFHPVDLADLDVKTIDLNDPATN